MARRLFRAEKFRMPVHSAPARPFATCSAHDQSSGSDFSSQCAMVWDPPSAESGRRPASLYGSRALEDVEAAAAVDQVEEPAPVHADVVAGDPLRANGNGRQERGDLPRSVRL